MIYLIYFLFTFNFNVKNYNNYEFFSVKGNEIELYDKYNKSSISYNNNLILLEVKGKIDTIFVNYFTIDDKKYFNLSNKNQIIIEKIESRVKFTEYTD